MKPEQVCDVVTEHGESVVHHRTWLGPRWVDMLAGDILELNIADGHVARARTGSDVAAFIAPRRDGGIAVATRSDVRVYSDPAGWHEGRVLDLAPVRKTQTIVRRPDERFNEGGCTPGGDLLLGTTTNPRTAQAAAVYAVAPDGGSRTVLADLTVCNGLVFDPSEGVMYYADTPTRTVTKAVYSEGEPIRSLETLDVAMIAGVPDGMCVDVEGGVWIAMFGGSAVVRLDSTGAVTERIDMPVSQPTSCAFEPAGTTLWVTTSAYGRAEEKANGAGALFRVDVGVSGHPVTETVF